MNKTPIEKAISLAGSQSALARSIGLKQGHVWYWLKIGRIPAERVTAVEKVTGISRHELRPDVFGPAPTDITSNP